MFQVKVRPEIEQMLLPADQNDAVGDGNAVWTPDGQYVIYSALGSGIWSVRSDGAGQPQPLSATNSIQLPTAVSRDGGDSRTSSPTRTHRSGPCRSI
jgi:Tol biopolymer transport system component